MTPVPPIALEGVVDSPRPHIGACRAEVSDATLGRLRDACATVVTDVAEVAEASRDWWPLAMQWALDGEVPGLASVVVRPESADEVAAILAVCNADRVPVTAAAGRSGVCGASVPVHGGVVLDMCGLAGIVDVDDASLVLDVLPGTFGEPLEHDLRATHGVTLGHWPQSVAISTVGGWLACRGAGQLSTRYGKIEDMVVGLDVALADGRTVTTGGAPRAAAGPDLTQLFVGSEGTLGVITGARLRVHPAPSSERRDAWSFGSFEDGLDACRRILRRGATPAVLRLYDDVEANRSYQTGDRHVLLVYDEGDAAIIDAVMRVVAEECDALGGERADVGLVDRWFHHRNEVSALEALTRKGFVVDTMEIAARWRDLPKIYAAARAAIMSVPGAAAATAHQSHAYTDGACLYFTFAGRPPAEEREPFYVAAWDAGTRAVLANGGALSHHHGVGLNRSRFVREALGRGVRRLAVGEGCARPERDLEPWEARPAVALRRGALAGRGVMKLDRSALVAGIVTAVIISVPAALIGQAIDDPSTNDNPSAGALLLVGVVLVGLAAGATVAAMRQQMGAPLVHGIVTAIVTFVLVQGIGVIRHIAANEDVLWSRVLSSALLSMVAGTSAASSEDACDTRRSPPGERRARTVSILVVDVGTSGVRAAIVRPDASVDHVHYREVLPSSPAPAFVEFDPREMADAALDAASAALAAGGPVDAIGIANQRASTIVWDANTGEPVGPGVGWQDLRTAGMCLVLAAEGTRFAPNQSATKLAFLLDMADPERTRDDLRFGTVDTWIAWVLSNGSLHVTDQSNVGVTGLVRGDGDGWDDHVLDVLRVPTVGAAGHRRLDRHRRPGDGAAGRAADRRDRRRPAGLADRPGMRAARARQGDVRHRRDARHVPRRRAARVRASR